MRARPGEGVDVLLARADDAMEQAKAAGRNQVMAIPEPAVEVRAAMRLFVVFGWAIYPIGFLLARSGYGELREIVYNVADVINKVGFGLVAYHGIRAIGLTAAARRPAMPPRLARMAADAAAGCAAGGRLSHVVTRTGAGSGADPRSRPAPAPAGPVGGAWWGLSSGNTARDLAILSIAAYLVVTPAHERLGGMLVSRGPGDYRTPMSAVNARGATPRVIGAAR